MATILFQQEVSSNNQILVKLSSADLPTGSLTVSLSFTYTASQASFSSAQFSGSSSTRVTGGISGSTGTVTISGAVVPSGTAPFATLVFNGQSSGTFNADVTSFRINGATVTFTDPPALPFTVAPLIETLNLTAGQSTKGEFDPFNSVFPSATIKSQAGHGTVALGSMFTADWTYTPTPGFYGQDQFVLKSTEGLKSTEKTFVVNISPVGTSGNDSFQSSKATYTVDGGSGIDTMSFSGKRENFTVTKSGAAYAITDKTGAEGAQALTNFERLKFADTTIALDTAGNAGQAYRLYQAAFDRKPDAGGLGTWIGLMDKGMSLAEVSSYFQRSEEFKTLYGTSVSNEKFVDLLYQNVLDRLPDAGGYATWKGVLDAGTWTREQVLIGFSESTENQVKVIGSIQNGIEYQPSATA